MAQTERMTTGQLAQEVDDLEQRVQELNTDRANLWTAMGSVVGIDGITVGVAAIAELLAPLRMLVPASTALALEPGVPGALATTRDALGRDRHLNFDSVPTGWEGPVEHIGHPDPALDPEVGRTLERSAQ